MRRPFAVSACPQPPLRQVVAGYLAALAKVQADELTSDASGFVTERPAKDRGAHRLASAVDLYATFRKHDDSPAVLGTNAVISTTATRIRACMAVTGSTPDSAAPAAVLHQQREAGLPLPPQLVMDRAGGWGKTRAQVDAISDGQTAMVAWVVFASLIVALPHLRYRWRTPFHSQAQAACRINRANAEQRVLARGFSSSQSARRMILSAEAVARCWSRVFGKPT